MPVPEPGAPGPGRERVLLASLDRVGDLVFTLPALEHLRAHRPDAELSFVTTAYAGGVLEGHPAVDRLLRVDRDGNSLRRFRAWRGFLAAWGPRPPDRLVLFREGHDGRALARRFAAARRDSVRDLPAALRESAHMCVLRLRLAERVAGAPGPAHPEPRLAVPARFAEAARARLAALGVEPDRGVALHPGANRLVRRRGWAPARRTPPPSPKLWPLPRWVELGRALVARGLVPVLTGSPGERAVCAELAQRIGPGALSTAGPLHVLELAALTASLRALVVSDTGPGHLAAAAGGRLVSLFGPTSPFRFAPLAPPARRAVLWRPEGCAACRAGGGTDRPGHTCMEALGVGDVLDALDAVCAAPAPAAATRP